MPQTVRKTTYCLLIFSLPLLPLYTATESSDTSAAIFNTSRSTSNLTTPQQSTPFASSTDIATNHENETTGSSTNPSTFPSTYIYDDSSHVNSLENETTQHFNSSNYSDSSTNPSTFSSTYIYDDSSQATEPSDTPATNFNNISDLTTPEQSTQGVSSTDIELIAGLGAAVGLLLLVIAALIIVVLILRHKLRRLRTKNKRQSLVDHSHPMTDIFSNHNHNINGTDIFVTPGFTNRVDMDKTISKPHTDIGNIPMEEDEAGYITISNARHLKEPDPYYIDVDNTRNVIQNDCRTSDTDMNVPDDKGIATERKCSVIEPDSPQISDLAACIAFVAKKYIVGESPDDITDNGDKKDVTFNDDSPIYESVMVDNDAYDSVTQIKAS